MDKRLIEHTLFVTGTSPVLNKTVKGTVAALGQLSAKFQIWTEKFGVTDEESLALWVCGNADKERSYFAGDIELVERLARSAYKKIDWSELPDDLGIAIP